ncbi:MAG: acetylxylan esterase [Nitrospirota bacterium]|nr:acetylxylan esterase [Nitrospirota bacterium]MDH5587516.1 acetylxylan esterase [Nitrospirota bacterium]
MQFKRLIKTLFPHQFQQWLWARKVAFGNRRILELGDHLTKQVHEAAHQDLCVFEGIRTEEEWESFCQKRITALRHSLTNRATHSEPPNYIVSTTVEHDRFRIENIVYQGHMDMPVTTNVYRPKNATHKTPAIVLCHSHHEPKTEEELQSMGMTLAQQGCTVLIMDLLGHGERRQHPFCSATDYNGIFRVDRQDYYFRSVLSMQLDLIGESFMGWIVQDVRHGIDCLWADPQIDQDRIILIGAVAGGGDVAAIAGALDDRVAAVAAFNFGHLSIGDWDSSRNLPDTARLRFWPWVILASLAPRRLIYGREFDWNPQHDVVWQHLEKVYALYGSRDALQSVHGSGRGSRHGPLDSHCTNIGPIHRKQLYTILQEWFEIPVPEHEVLQPVQQKSLESLTRDSCKVFNIRMVHEITQEIAQKHLTTFRQMRSLQDSTAQVVQLRQALTEGLGPMTLYPSSHVRSTYRGIGQSEYVVLEVEENLSIRVQLLRPSGLGKTKTPIVIGFAQEGNLRLQRARRSLIQSLLGQKVAVCLAELRGIGDGRHGELYRGRLSPSAGAAATSLMLGESLIVSRVRDLRTVIDYLCNRKDINQERIGLWGDSLAATNSISHERVVPLDASPYPARGEPLGGVAALLTALHEPHIQAVYIHGGILSYGSLLEHPFIYQPADSMIRGLLKIADLPDIGAALAPRPLRMECIVDGCNQLVSRSQLERTYEVVRAAYVRAGKPDQLSLEVQMSVEKEISDWFLSYLG